MKCENKFCIYLNNHKCTLDSICLNEMGICLDCVYIDISDELLQAEKEKLINKTTQINNY